MKSFENTIIICLQDKRLVCSCIVTCISVNRSPRKEIKEWRIVPPSWKNLRYRGPEKMTSHTLKYEENVGEEVVVDHGDVFFPRPRRREGRKKSSPVDLLKAQGQSEAAVSLCTTCSGCYGATQVRYNFKKPTNQPTNQPTTIHRNKQLQRERGKRTELSDPSRKRMECHRHGTSWRKSDSTEISATKPPWMRIHKTSFRLEQLFF
ncbi:uncharacterized protein LOC140704068 isoform X2 [Pogona vitticeps]